MDVKSKNTLIVLTVLILSGAPFVYSATYGDDTPAVPASQKSDTKGPVTRDSSGATTSGTIESVNIPSNEIVMVSDSGARRRCTVNGSASVTNGVSTISLADLKPGDSVTVTEDATGQVTEVRVNSSTK